MQQHFGYKGRIGADHEGVTHKMGMQAQSGSQCADTTADLEIRDGSDLGPTNKFGLRATREVAAKKPGGRLRFWEKNSDQNTESHPFKLDPGINPRVNSEEFLQKLCWGVILTYDEISAVHSGARHEEIPSSFCSETAFTVMEQTSTPPAAKKTKIAVKK